MMDNEGPLEDPNLRLGTGSKYLVTTDGEPGLIVTETTEIKALIEAQRRGYPIDSTTKVGPYI